MRRALPAPAVLVWALGAWGCRCEPEPVGMIAEDLSMPYERIPAGEHDPAERGPDDSTVLDAMPGGWGRVLFRHFTHSSSEERGHGIPCRDCHHATPAGKEPGEGCVGCHRIPDRDDPAHEGPDDVMVLRGEWRRTAAAGPVPFGHFTHASSRGYGIRCDRCHHTGDEAPCAGCHGPVAMVAAEGGVVPKTRRAYHLMCRGCHQAFEARNPGSAAPTECGGCHTGRLPGRVDGELTLNRALHVSCIRCHEGVRAASPRANAPTRVCAGCHEGGHTGRPREEPSVAPPAADAEQGPATLTIRLGEGGMPAREFAHGAHVGYADSCARCHHRGLDDATCSGCHTPADSRRVYHKLCIDCHRERGAPAGCQDCH